MNFQHHYSSLQCHMIIDHMIISVSEIILIWWFGQIKCSLAALHCS